MSGPFLLRRRQRRRWCGPVTGVDGCAATDKEPRK
jgi:hypothetical protein